MVGLLPLFPLDSCSSSVDFPRFLISAQFHRSCASDGKCQVTLLALNNTSLLGYEHKALSVVCDELHPAGDRSGSSTPHCSLPSHPAADDRECVKPHSKDVWCGLVCRHPHGRTSPFFSPNFTKTYFSYMFSFCN